MDIYLFDWGDTLMVDFPNMPGKMYQWPTVQAVPGAQQALQRLAANAQIYIASGAAQSSALDIKRAFDRVGLSGYISGYFCKDNVGCAKGTREFLRAIIRQLNRPDAQITMVGDNFVKDIRPALAVGIQAIWFNPRESQEAIENVQIIQSLNEL